MQDTELVPACPICGHSDNERDWEFEALLGLIEPFGVRRCATCGLRWLSPRLTARGYVQLYEYENYFDGPRSVEYYPELARQRRSYFRHRIGRIERSLSPDSTSLRILDVGAATGEFVHEAALKGHQAIGIELSAGARAKAKESYGIDLLGNDLTELESTHSYDVIHMNHVFEHLPDPTEALRACHGLLRDGGMLVLEVPQQLHNDLDRLKRFMGMQRRPRFTAYSLHHTYFFEPESLTRLLSSNRFHVLSLRTSNAARTPLWPPSVKNLILRCYLQCADRLHRGGNIIEVYCRVA